MQHIERDSQTDCWGWIGHKNADGYGVFYVSKSVKQKLAHRVAYEAVRGPIPEGLIVRHTCDRPSCVNPDHLLVGSHADNVADMDRRGRRVRPDVPGTKNPNCKTDELTVVQIRRDYVSGVSWPDIISKYGRNKDYLSKITCARTWKHILGKNGCPTLEQLKTEARHRLWLTQGGKKSKSRQ